jgi:EmrB/QacA subfamily drug resistance transporter
VLAIYAGLMLLVVLGVVDQTIVATALPSIVSDLPGGHIGSYSWTFTAYLLFQAITTPFYGKLGDIYGRRKLLLFATSLFIVASGLCAAAQTMEQLVLFRALQGVGAGGMIPLALSTVGRIVPPRERGRYHGLFSIALGAGAVLGPILGGVLVEAGSWRFIFLVNVPIGGLALAIIALTLPARSERVQTQIDYLGGALLAVGAGALVLALTMTGPVQSPRRGELLAAAVVLLAVFVFAERRASDPVIPWHTLSLRNVSAPLTSYTLISVCHFGLIAFIPLYAQCVLGVSPAGSGIFLVPMVLGMVLGGIIGGQVMSRTGKYRTWLTVNCLLVAASLGYAVTLGASANEAAAIVAVMLAGFAIGGTIQSFLIVAQNAVPVAIMGALTGTMQFARNLGGMFGVALFGAIVYHGLSPTLQQTARLGEQFSPSARDDLATALHPAFLVGALAGLAAAVIAWFGIDEVPLRRGHDQPGTPAARDASRLVFEESA